MHRGSPYQVSTIMYGALSDVLRHGACDLSEQVRSGSQSEMQREHTREKARSVQIYQAPVVKIMPQKPLTSKGNKSLPKLKAANRHGKVIKHKKG